MKINRQAALGRMDTDIIVLCRGGGSFEDLAAFNDERLAREIRRSTIPVVSAVGHEIDFTIADFAADLRAPTPSAAAEMLLPDNAALADQTAALTRRLRLAMRTLLVDKQACLASLEHRLRQTSPAQALAAQEQKLAELERRLAQATNRLLREKEENLARAAGLLDAVSPLATLARGYAVARKNSGAVITATAQVEPSEEIEILLRKGRLRCAVVGKT